MVKTPDPGSLFCFTPWTQNPLHDEFGWHETFTTHDLYQSFLMFLIRFRPCNLGQEK